MSLGGATGYMRPEDYLVSNGGSSSPYLPYAQSGPYQDIMSRMGNQGYVSANQIAPASLSSGAMGGYDPNMYQRAAAPAASVAPTTTRVSNTQRGFTPGPVDLTDPYSASIVAANPAAYADFNPKRGSGVDLTDPYAASIVAANPDAYVDYNPKRGSPVDLTDPYSASQYYASGPNWSNVGGSAGLQARQEAADPAAWRNQTAEQQSQHYANNPTQAEITRGIVGAWGYTTPGMIQNALDPSQRQNIMGILDRASEIRSGVPGLAKGGQVSMQHLQGPNPAGPDEGYGALKSGEFVINDKAVSKYGIEIMNAINSGKISKGKLRGLLEM